MKDFAGGALNEKAESRKKSPKMYSEPNGSPEPNGSRANELLSGPGIVRGGLPVTVREAAEEVFCRL